MGKSTTVNEALAKWSAKTGEKASKAKIIRLDTQLPPIEKLSPSLSKLVNCEELSLTNNCITKITSLSGMEKLKFLSLGRNLIKAFTGLDPVKNTLEELWISHNSIEKMRGIHVLKNLKVLYMSNNLVSNWDEFDRLKDLPCLEELVFVGNPLQEKHLADGTWQAEVSKRLPNLKKLDGVLLVRTDMEDGDEDDDENENDE